VPLNGSLQGEFAQAVPDRKLLLVALTLGRVAGARCHRGRDDRLAMMQQLVAVGQLPEVTGKGGLAGGPDIGLAHVLGADDPETPRVVASYC
jgi:hypothetical protein